MEKIKQTSWSILGLQFKEAENEYVLDGKNWIYFSEPTSGWESTEKNSLAYLAIKEKIKPYLKITSKNQIKKTTDFTLENPTIYKLKDIKLTFDSNLNSFLSYTENLGDINPGASIDFNVSLNEGFFGNEQGNLMISGVDGKGSKIEFITMPIALIGPNPFEIEVTNPALVSSEGSDIYLSIKKNIDTFSAECSYTNPFNKAVETVNVNENLNNIKLSNRVLLTGNFSFDINCKGEKNSFSFPIDLEVNLAPKNFKIENSIATIDSLNDFSIKITNIQKEKEVLTFDIVGDLVGVILPTDKSKIIAPNDKRELFLFVLAI